MACRPPSDQFLKFTKGTFLARTLHFTAATVFSYRYKYTQKIIKVKHENSYRTFSTFLTYRAGYVSASYISYPLPPPAHPCGRGSVAWPPLCRLGRCCTSQTSAGQSRHNGSRACAVSPRGGIYARMNTPLVSFWMADTLHKNLYTLYLLRLSFYVPPLVDFTFRLLGVPRRHS